MFVLCTDGVGWGGAITFNCSCTPTSCYVTAGSSQRLCCTQMGWGGVGWGNNVQLQLHTHVMLRYRTFISLLQTHVMLRYRTFISMFVLCTDGVGWGGAITFNCSCTLTSCYATARSSQCLCCAQIGWGGVGWGNNVQLQWHTHVMLRYHTFISLLQTHVMLRYRTFISMFVLCTDGVGWGGAITFNCSTLHSRHATLPKRSSSLVANSRHATLPHVHLTVATVLMSTTRAPQEKKVCCWIWMEKLNP